jgi:CheY-like chemotaxis protein
VEAHDGVISVYSEGENTGKGSIFYIDIPVSTQLSNKSNRSEKAMSPSAGEEVLNTTLNTLVISPPAAGTAESAAVLQSVLVVDDSRNNRKMLTKLLQTKKIPHIEEAIDGADALIKYKHSISGAEGAHPYDVIMMDFVMPIMDGPTATKELRALGYKGLIVGVTGNSLPADVDFFLQSGVNEVMLKPLDISRFMTCVTNEIQS